MKKLISRFAVLAILLCPALSAADLFSAYAEKSLSAASTTVSFQKSAGGLKIRPLQVDLYCAAACVVTITRDGTLASGAIAATPVNFDGVLASTAVVYIDSNTTPGSTVRKVVIPAGATIPIVFSKLFWQRSQGLKSLEFTTTAITGIFSASITWEEYN